jgi:hypothetical protein
MRERFGPFTFKGWVFLGIALGCSAFWYLVMQALRLMAR